jgi:hypothetical protein
LRHSEQSELVVLSIGPVLAACAGAVPIIY